MKAASPSFVLILLAVVHFASSASALARDNSEFVVFTRRTNPFVLDGTLESEWRTVEPILLTHQVEPDEGEPSSFRTDVYILYTTEALYLAFNCHDTTPDSIAGRIQRRDNYNNSDRITLNLDTFHDHRTGYYFGVTAAGVQYDGIWSNETDQDDSWDGIWESAVAHHDSGYVVEMRIPFQSIRHGGPRPDGWGLNAFRWVERKSEWVSWVPIERASGNRVNLWGVLRGMEQIESARHLELLPHVVGRWDANDGGDWHSVNDWENIGLDLKLVPASSWTMDLTFQPDFAQVDVDDEVINLSDYPIYLEEKRPFFLEGLGLFDGLPTTMLYTRKIANPDIGARITGQWGSTRSSIFTARNRTEEGLVQAAFAGRVVRNIGHASSVGFTATSISDTSFHASTASVDHRIRWGNEHEINLFASLLDKQVLRHATTVEASDGSDSTVVIPADDYSDQPVSVSGDIFLGFGNWRGNTGVGFKGQDFDVNDLGFTGYSNVINHWLWIQRAFFLPKGSWMDVTRHNFNFWQEVFPDGTHWEKGGNWNGYLRTSSNWYFGGGVGLGDGYFRYTHDPDDEDQNIADYPYRHNFGSYRVDYYPYHSQWIWFDTDYRKPVGFSINLENGTLRDGDRRAVYSNLLWKALPNLELHLNHSYIQVEDVQDRHDGALTHYSIFRFKTRWSPTLDLSFRATLQYVEENVRSNDLEDENALLLNVLFAWNWTPGSWFYLVYDDSRDWSVESGAAIGRWDVGDRTIRTKWTWFVSVP